MEIEDFNKIQNNDTVVTLTDSGELEWEVRYINRIEGWVEVSDEEDTMRVIFYPHALVRHIPFV